MCIRESRKAVEEYGELAGMSGFGDVFAINCFQAEDGIRDAQESRRLVDVYKRQAPLFQEALKAHPGYGDALYALEFVQDLPLIHI